MLNNGEKGFVYTVFNKNKHGFTFVTLLLTITLLFMSLPFAAYIIRAVTYTSNYYEISIQQFFYFLRDDVIEATGYVVEANGITLHKNDGSDISIENYSNLIRRRVDGQGHEIYLRNVKEATFISLPYGIHVKITSLQGETYEKTIIFYQ